MNNNNQITLEHAEEWTALWRKKCPDNCKAFSIPVQDLVNVLKEIGVIREAGNTGLYMVDEKTTNGVRAYMAIDPKEEAGGGEKLLLVGTQPQMNRGGKIVQRDIINGKLDNKGHRVTQGNTDLTAAEPNTGIFDFTQPCPDFCDPESPLS
ncbi:MAG: hypothetical protein JKY02_00485 [Flavobacteriaceae bacterium]|nr:hypothetical protein [Flavobacteriaceae bacterium]